MRIALIIFTILIFLITAGLGILASSNGFGSEADEVQKMVDDLASIAGDDSAEVKAMQEIVDGYKTSSTGALLIVLLALVAVIMMFIKNPKGSLIVMGIIIGTALLFIILSPSLDTGDKADPRTQAMMYGIPGMLCGLMAFGTQKLRKKE